MKLAPPVPIGHNGHAHVVQLAVPSVELADFKFHTVSWQADGFGFDTTTGEFFTASPTALLVMQSLSKKLNRQQILDRLISTFEVARSTAERDLESFLADLTTMGLGKS